MKPILGQGLGLGGGSVGSRQVPSMPAGKNAAAPIQINRWVRNGTHPSNELEVLKNEAINQCALYRTKDYFAAGRIATAPSTADDERWRFAFRSSEFAHAALVSCVVNQPAPGTGNTNSYVELKLFTDATESTLAHSEQFNYGSRVDAASASGWTFMRTFDKIVPITPNTDYYALVKNMNWSTLVSITAYELTSLTEHFAGYLPMNLGVQAPILDVYRQKQRELLRKVWKTGGPKIFNWTIDRGSYSVGTGSAPSQSYKDISRTTYENILDWTHLAAGSTTVTANTPGWYPDTRTWDRVRQGGTIPCVMKAFGKWTAGGGFLTGGSVALKDPTGAIVAQISDAWDATPRWHEVAVNLPADYKKYDVHFKTNAGTFHLWAVTIYPLET